METASSETLCPGESLSEALGGWQCCGAGVKLTVHFVSFLHPLHGLSLTRASLASVVSTCMTLSLWSLLCQPCSCAERSRGSRVDSRIPDPGTERLWVLLRGLS